MQEENEFNPYRKLLGISARITKPNYYQLLGLENFETDTDIISNAADARLMALKTFQLGPHSADSQRLMNEVSQARVCLVNPEKRAEYDAKLQRELEAQRPTSPGMPAAPMGGAFPTAFNAAPMPMGPVPMQSVPVSPMSGAPISGPVITGSAISSPVISGSAVSPTPAPPAPPATGPTPPPVAGDEKKNVVPPPVEEPASSVKIKTTSKGTSKTTSKGYRSSGRSSEPKTPKKVMPTGTILGVICVLALLVMVGAGMYLRSQSLSEARLKNARAKVQTHLKKADDFIQQWDWDAAEKELASAVRILPAQSEYKPLWEKIREGRQNQQKVEKHFYQAQIHQKTKAWDTALAEVEQALALGGGKLLSELEQLKRACQSGLKAEEAMNQLRASMAQRDWNTALAAVDKVGKLSSDYAEELEKLRAECQAGQQTQELLTQVQNQQQASNWHEAVEIVNKALELKSPAYEADLKKLKADCLSRMKNEERMAQERAEASAKKLAEQKRREKLLAEEKARKAGEKMTKTVKGVKFTFCWCPAGKFTMGSQQDEKGHMLNETQHEVTLSRGFWILESEVTQRMWRALMPEKANLSSFKGDDLPMENVSWDECQEFCRRLAEQVEMDVALPTEAQWEYACRAGTTGAYAGNYKRVMWYSENANRPEKETKRKTATTPRSKGPQPVKRKIANAWNLYDMHGNVREWCADWYEEGYYSVSPSKDPMGPSSGTERVVRGGAWDCNAEQCRSACRDKALLFASGTAPVEENLLDEYRSTPQRNSATQRNTNPQRNPNFQRNNGRNGPGDGNRGRTRSKNRASDDWAREAPEAMNGEMPEVPSTVRLPNGQQIEVPDEMKETVQGLQEGINQAMQNGQDFDMQEGWEQMRKAIETAPQRGQRNQRGQWGQQGQWNQQGQQGQRGQRNQRSQRQTPPPPPPVEFRQNNLGFRPIMTVSLGETPTDEQTPMNERAPSDERVPGDEQTPIEETNPTDEPVPTIEPAPVDESVPADESLPTEKEPFVRRKAPADEQALEGEGDSVNEQAPSGNEPVEQPLPMIE